ncbi:HTTM domain-containing protein [Streptomyces sp. NBC_00669]|uniref:HTTM domain-containing protein n=1 Tax=Streptomyces sp. NBC_00669 TaxID=2976011 RepID=UPI002E371E28|nr:HTTM domain-containing protein [Streptomyces sp. NBC_00669]
MTAPRSHAETPAGRHVPATPTYAGVTAALDRGVTRGLARITSGAIGPYQSAVVRIGMSLTWLLYLLREFPHRGALYGPHSAWGFDLAQRLLAGNHAFSVLMWSDSRAWFEIGYAFAILASAALMLGWRTRTSALMFMVGVLSLQNRSVFMGDGGDNVVHIIAIYLAFTRCGQVWSLDSRRARRRAEKAEAEAEVSSAAVEAGGQGSGAGVDAAGDVSTEPAPGARAARAGVDPVGVALWTVFGAVLLAASFGDKLSTGWDLVFWACWVGHTVWWAVRRYAPGEPRTVLDIIANVVHNGAMLVIVVEVCLIYSTAGWYKIQGSRWQDGTALYYPLHLDDFTPWPALSHTLASHAVMVMLITYGTVIVQVAFPFTLFNRRVKNVLLVGMIIEHASIAVVLGLPFFSLAMISADAVFLPTGFLLWAEQRITGRRRGRERATGALPGQRADDLAEPAAGPPPPSAVT